MGLSNNECICCHAYITSKIYHTFTETQKDKGLRWFHGFLIKHVDVRISVVKDQIRIIT